MMIEKASASAKDEEDKFSFTIVVTDLGMQIGETKRFWVKAGPASPDTSRLKKTYESSTAGKTVELIVDTYDQYGNHRSFDDADEDELDMGKFQIELLDGSGAVAQTETPQIERVSSGSFKISIMKTVSRPFTYHVTYDGTRISNSPAHIIFNPADFEVEQSEASGEALKRFVPKHVDLRPNRFRIWARDEFGNIIPGRDIEKHLNVSLLAFQEEDETEGFTGFSDSKLRTVVTEVPIEILFEPDGSMTFSFVVNNQYIDYIELTANYTLTGDFIQYDNKPLNSYRISPSQIIHVKTVSNQEMFFVMVFAGIVNVYTLIIMFLVWFWKNENAIKFSQRKLLNLLLVGCIFVNVTIMLTTVPQVIEWRYSCSLYIWGAVIGLTLIEYTLIAKLHRVHTIAYAQAMQRKKITDSFLLKRIFVAMLVTCLYTLVASIMAPLYKQPFQSPEPDLDKYGTEHYSEISECPWMKDQIWTPLAFIVIGALICVCAMATQSRKIPSAFAESKWIALSMYTLILCLCFVGLLFNDPNLKFEQPAFYHAGVATPITLASFVFMTLMFLPKFRKILKGKKLEITDIKPHIDDDSLGDGMELQRVNTGVRRASSRHDSRFSMRGSSRFNSAASGIGGIGSLGR